MEVEVDWVVEIVEVKVEWVVAVSSGSRSSGSRSGMVVEVVEVEWVAEVMEVECVAEVMEVESVVEVMEVEWVASESGNGGSGRE